MKPATLIDIAEVRRLFEQHTPDLCAARGTVNKWLAARGVASHYASPKRRLFSRRAVVSALAADFPGQEGFVSVADAFRLCGRPYPHPRGGRGE